MPVTIVFYLFILCHHIFPQPFSGLMGISNAFYGTRVFFEVDLTEVNDYKSKFSVRLLFFVCFILYFLLASSNLNLSSWLTFKNDNGPIFFFIECCYHWCRMVVHGTSLTREVGSMNIRQPLYLLDEFLQTKYMSILELIDSPTVCVSRIEAKYVFPQQYVFYSVIHYWRCFFSLLPTSFSFQNIQNVFLSL